jgi:hypothetical protein
MENILVNLKTSIMKKQLSLVTAGILLLAICEITTAQSRYETGKMKYRDFEKKYSIPAPVVATFYSNHSGIDNVVQTKYIPAAEVYEITYLDGEKEVQSFYLDGTASEDPQLLAVGHYSTWEEFPEQVQNKLTRFDPQSLKQFYVIDKDGSVDYFALRQAGDNQVLVKYDANGLVSSNIVYDAKKAARKEGRYYKNYKVAYNTTKITDLLFAQK